MQACVNQALASAKEICAAKNLRFTNLRQKVMTIIWQSHKPAKAYDILDKLKTIEISPKPPTVYRALNFLMATGLIHKLNSLNAYVGCTHPLKHTQCHFLICGECGEIQECCSDKLSKAIINTASTNKFYAQKITMEISGLCERCQ